MTTLPTNQQWLRAQVSNNNLTDLGDYIVTRKDTVYLTIYGTIKRTTDKAILVALDNERTIYDLEVSPAAYNKGVWIPLSQCLQMNETTTQGQDTLTISEWIAEKPGIEGSKNG